MTDETFGMPHSLLYQDEYPSEYVYAKSKNVERLVETDEEGHGARTKACPVRKLENLTRVV